MSNKCSVWLKAVTVSDQGSTVDMSLIGIWLTGIMPDTILLGFGLGHLDSIWPNQTF